MRYVVQVFGRTAVRIIGSHWSARNAPSVTLEGSTKVAVRRAATASFRAACASRLVRNPPLVICRRILVAGSTTSTYHVHVPPRLRVPPLIARASSGAERWGHVAYG